MTHEVEWLHANGKLGTWKMNDNTHRGMWVTGSMRYNTSGITRNDVVGELYTMAKENLFQRCNAN